MNDNLDIYPFGKDFDSDCHNTSVPLDDGGDTHMHANRDGTATVTVRLPGIDGSPAIEEHLRFSSNGDPLSH